MSQDIEVPGTELDEVRAANAMPGSSAMIMSPGQYDAVWRMSKALAHSGSFKDIGREDASKALARIMLGADLGMSPTQALMGIDIVKGNPQIRGVALGRMVRQSAKRPTPSGESYDYAVIDRGFEPNAEYAVVALYRRDDDGAWPRVLDDGGVTFPTIVGPYTIAPGQRYPEAVEAFKLDQARKRQLIKTDGAWQTQPEVMVVWRALSQAVRFYAPDVIGGMPVYTDADGLRADLVTTGGEDPEWTGWEGVPYEKQLPLDMLVKRAQSVGHAGLSDRHTILMRVRGMTPEALDVWLEEQNAEVTAMAERAQPKGDAPSLTFGGETFYFNDTDDPYAMLEAALAEGPESMRATAHDADVAAEHEPDPARAAWWRSVAESLRAQGDAEEEADG